MAIDAHRAFHEAQSGGRFYNNHEIFEICQSRVCHVEIELLGNPG